MRPIKLTMSAFGPYAGETVIDFDKLGERVLKSAGYRNRASERNIELRELLRRKL